jgi:hypothetical protein
MLPVSKENTQSVILDLVQVLVLSRYLQPALLTFPPCLVLLPETLHRVLWDAAPAG